MKLCLVLTLLIFSSSIYTGNATTLSSCNDLDPLVDTTPSWQSVDDGSGAVMKYCAPRVPLTNYGSCDIELGLQSREIPDENLSASSTKDDLLDVYGPAYARILDARTLGTGWLAGTEDANQWVLVDTEALSIVTGIATQGRGWRGPESWIRTYSLEHSLDGVSYTTYTEDDEGIDGSTAAFVFNANYIAYEIVQNDFASPFVSRYVKINIVLWRGDYMAMRVELYGCRYAVIEDENLISTANLEGAWYYDTSSGSPEIKYKLIILSSPIDLDRDLGMEDEFIEDSSISASTTLSGSNAADGRLNHAGGWTANVADANQYLQIHLRGNCYISMIEVQGASSSAYTETYYIKSSWDGETFTPYNYQGSQWLFTGNSGDGDTGVREYLPYPLFCLAIRINPQTYTGSQPSLRVELYGLTIAPTVCSYWYDVGKTTPGFYMMAVGTNPTTYDGVYCSFNTSYTRCLDYMTAGYTTDGYYWVYPSGVNDGLPVYCFFDTIVNAAYSKIYHDNMGEVALAFTSTKQAGSVDHPMTYGYNLAVSDIVSLISGEDYCYQTLSYTSYDDAQIWDGSDQNVWWESNDGTQMTYWPGADPAGASGCRCGQLGNCVDPSQKCHSDTDSEQPLTDGGFITDSSKLPVTALKLGGYSRFNSATYRLSELVCMSSSTTLPTSCLDAQTSGFTTEGVYMMDPDGSAGPLEPLLGVCSFISVHNAVLTYFRHHFAGERQIDDYDGAGSFAVDIVYNAPYDSLASLAASSTACSQYLKFRCYGSEIQSSGTQNTWWVSSDGTRMDHWSGTSESGKCACGATSSCYDSSKDCNCEDDSDVWKEDKGYITDASKLPVSQIRSGDTDSSKFAYVTLGSFKCYERVGPLMRTCYDVKQSGATDDGYYLLDPDGSGPANAFIAECGLSYNSTHATTTFNHDSEDRTHTAGHKSAGSFIQSIVYENMDVAQLTAQFELSEMDYHQTCEQYIEYDCYNTRLFKGGTSWWVTFKGETKTYWGGSNGQNEYCACGVDSTCYSNGKNCNCDAERSQWLEDAGYLTDVDEEVLPVVQLRFGDTNGGAGSEEGYFTLGKLECFVSEHAERW